MRLRGIELVLFIRHQAFEVAVRDMLYMKIYYESVSGEERNFEIYNE